MFFSWRTGVRVRTFVWLAFIAVPLVSALRSHNSGAAKAATIAAAAVFVGLYATVALKVEKPLPPAGAVPAIGALLGIAISLTVADRAEWAQLFIFLAGCSAVALPGRLAPAGVVAAIVACVAALAIDGAGTGAVIGYGTSTAGIGMLLLVLADLRRRNQELVEARAELARLAVAEERVRFARDLHDLLGHSLSVIALKAELAGRLLPHHPADAGAHVGEIEQVARGALTEVREAVSGYRQPTLEGELAGARMALAAAGIEASIDRPSVALDPAVEAVLAWAVREGATNVIRHSGAARCSVRLTATVGDATVEVVDDGRGAGVNGSSAGSDGGGGHGIAGLAERVELLRGRVDAGRTPDGGYRLLVSVPRTPA